jgi:hypothetical protein
MGGGHGLFSPARLELPLLMACGPLSLASRRWLICAFVVAWDMDILGNEYGWMGEDASRGVCRLAVLGLSCLGDKRREQGGGGVFLWLVKYYSFLCFSLGSVIWSWSGMVLPRQANEPSDVLTVL